VSDVAVQDQVLHVLHLLANKKYREIEFLTSGRRLSASQIEDAISQYGRTLVDVPTEGRALIDVVAIRSDPAHRWSIVVPLWTKEEGRSDLSAHMTAIREGSKTRIELDDIRVD
jgi:hypothetical protein